MIPRSAIVLVFDRLGSSFLGPYGNTWIDTPAWNRLSDQSLLFESFIADSPRLGPVYRSFWQGISAVRPAGDAGQPALPEQLEKQGVPTTLLTDSPTVAELPLAERFTEKIVVPVNWANRAAPSVEATQLAQLNAAAMDWLAHAKPPFLLWVHAQAMEGPWDAPLDLRDQFADEEDPTAERCTAPPSETVDQDTDPDRLLALSHAYAGQVVAMDACLEILLTAIEVLADSTLLIAASPRGFPLGEHGHVGGGGDNLYAEVLQVPLIVRHPTQHAARRRLQELVQPVDLCATLQNHFSLTAAPQCGGAHSLLDVPVLPAQHGHAYVCSVIDSLWSIRTPTWFYRDSLPPQLFVKPDDRFEVNEIADRCAATVGEFQAALRQIRQVTQSGYSESPPQISQSLTDEEH